LATEHIGGSLQKFEDWAYYVIGRSNFGQLAPQWILLDDIGGPVSPPASILDLNFKTSKKIDQLLADGERELFEYFLHNPKLLEQLRPKQFEQLVAAVYRNSGFAVEPIGAWNQEDGGVDILATSKLTQGRSSVS